MTSDKKLQAWERDIINRQRNIVFPDSVLNEVRFYRHIIRYKMQLNMAQRIGVMIVSAAWIAGGFLALIGSIVAARDAGEWMAGLTSLVAYLLMVLFGFLLADRGVTAASAPKPPRWWLKQRSRRT